MGYRLAEYIETLEFLGYSVMITEDLSINALCVRLGKSGVYVLKSITLNDITNYVLGIESIKLNCLREAREELDKKLKIDNSPRWTGYQVEALTDISNRLEQYAHGQTNESVRLRFENLATEVKNIIPMEMIKMKGEEK